jgi:hypothetical protein
MGLLGAACSRRSPPVEPAPPSVPASVSAPAPGAAPGPELRRLEWTLPDWPGGPARVVVLAPAWTPPEVRHPVLIALHGRGEALKGPDRGALGWPDDYQLVRAVGRLRAPPLTAADLEGLVEPEHLAAINLDLASRPFPGLVVACPFVPDLRLERASELATYGRALTEQLLPRVRAETPALATPESTGIDGVSLGGAVALRVGLARADAFAAVGALQPAIAEWQVGELTELVRAARARRKNLALRLTTSKEDGFRRPTERLSAALRKGGLAHDFAVLPGPHDYVFNRGPGVYEMLLWHAAQLAR